MTPCARCDQAKANAKAAGHRDWAAGVCFDHAALILGEPGEQFELFPDTSAPDVSDTYKG